MNTALGLSVYFDSLNAMLLVFARYTKYFVTVYTHLVEHSRRYSLFVSTSNMLGSLNSTLENLYFVNLTFIRFSIHSTGLR